MNLNCLYFSIIDFFLPNHFLICNEVARGISYLPALDDEPGSKATAFFISEIITPG
jgi:hypothetical protein